MSRSTGQPLGWNTWLTSPEQEREVGFLGRRVPYLLLLRAYVLLGIVLRFSLHYQGMPLSIRRQYVLIGIVACMAFLLVLHWRLIRCRVTSRLVFASLASADTLCVSFAYMLTGVAVSDVFLFYSLPIMIAVDYLPARWLVALTTLVIVCFTSAVLELNATGQAIVSQILPRVFYLLGLASIAGSIFRRERLQKWRLRRQSILTQSLLVFGKSSDRTFDRESILSSTAETAARQLNLEWCSASSVLETIKIERGWPPSRDLNTCLGSRSIDIVGERGKIGELRLPAFASLDLDAVDFLSSLAARTGGLLERSQLISAIRNINERTTLVLDLNRQLEGILEEVTTGLGFDFATITLVDDYRGVVETRRGRGVPPGWTRRSCYPIGQRDIQTFVITTRQTQILVESEGLDKKLFNKEMYDRFQQKTLARIWVPIMVGETSVGTIEAGVQKERKYLLHECQAALESIGRDRGPDISASRPQVLLETIARHAADIIGADSASVHIFRSPSAERDLLDMTVEDLAEAHNHNSPVLAAGAGRATEELLLRLLPRPEGAGWAAVHRRLGRHPCDYVVQDSAQLKEFNKPLWDRGVRWSVALPLSILPDVRGILYVQSWADGRRDPAGFSVADVEIERVFSGHVEVAIRQYFLLDSAASSIAQSMIISDWLKTVQSPSSGEVIDTVLDGVAQNVLLAADADNVVIYQVESPRGFGARPTVKGSFRQPKAMRTELAMNHPVESITPDSRAMYYEDVRRERPDFTRPRGVNPRFVEREDIVSCAILPLRGKPGDPLIGAMFVNFRDRRTFDTSARNTLEALAASAAVGLRTANFYQRINRSFDALSFSREIDQRIIRGAPELGSEEIERAVLERAIKLCGASGGVLSLVEGGNIRVLASQPQLDVRQNDVAARQSSPAIQNNSIILSNFTVGYASMLPGSRTGIAVPLAGSAGAPASVLYLEHAAENAFSSLDEVLLQVIGMQAMIARHTIDGWARLQLQIKREEAMSVVAAEIQTTGYSLEVILRMILTGITAGSGLAYSRAMLFLKDDNDAVLVGHLAIGAESWDEANANWERIALRPLADLLLAVSEFESDKGRLRTEVSRLELAVRNMHIPIGSISQSALARCIASRTIRYSYGSEPHPDVFRATYEEGTGDTPYVIPFAAVPVARRDEVFGVIVVDNRFLTHERNPLDKTSEAGLRTFGELAALSIEASRLRGRSEVQLYHDLTHQMRSTARAAHIQAENALAVLGKPALAQDLRCLVVLTRKTTILTKRINFFAELAAGDRPRLAKVEVNLDGLEKILSEARAVVAATYPEHTLLIESPPRDLIAGGVLADPELVAVVVDSVLDNAAKYNFSGNLIRLSYDIDDQFLSLLVSNKGIHLSAEDARRVLNERGWRSPQAIQFTDEGSGLGIWLARNIMKAHGGEFDLRPTNAEGDTTAVISFPRHRWS